MRQYVQLFRNHFRKNPESAGSHSASPTRSPTVTPISILPTEVMHMVIKFLPRASAMSFSLTCKDLHSIIGIPTLTEEERWDFLTILQRALPKLYLCQPCAKFHSFPESTGPKHYPFNPSACESETSGMGYRRPSLEFELTFHHVQLAMNRHFFGDSHGIPLQALEMDQTSTVWPAKSEESKVKLHNTWSAKIIHDELFLHVSYHFYHRHRYRDIRTTVTNLAIDLCFHRSMDKMFRAQLREFESYESLRATQGVTGADGSVLTSQNACPDCFTDYEVTIRGKRPKEWQSVFIKAWHQLGQGRSLTDPKWKAYTQPRHSGTGPVPIHEPGSIRKLYESW